MDAFDGVVLFPTAEHLPLLDPLTLVMLLFFLPFTGVLLVTTAGSLLARVRHPGLARDLMDTATGNRAAWIVFGLLPLVTMVALFTQLLTGTAAQLGTYLVRVLVMYLVAFALLYLYQRRRHPVAGLAGLALLLGGVFHFAASWSLLSYPEKWDFVRGPLPFLFSIQVVINVLMWIALAITLAGGAVLLVFFQWPDRHLHTPEETRPLLRGLALGASLGGALAAAPLLVWKLYTAPIQGLSPAVYRSSLLLLLVLLAWALLAAGMIRARHTRWAWIGFALSLAAFGLFVHMEQSLHASAMKEQRLVLAAHAEKLRAELVAQREALYGAGQELGLAAGERIYHERCSACHQFDRKVVGPPYNDVLPKYKDDFDALAAFILNPRKIDPAYPAMPNQGVRRAEARAVAAYLWKEFTGVDPTAAAAGEGAPETENATGSGEAARGTEGAAGGGEAAPGTEGAAGGGERGMEEH